MTVDHSCWLLVHWIRLMIAVSTAYKTLVRVKNLLNDLKNCYKTNGILCNPSANFITSVW